MFVITCIISSKLESLDGTCVFKTGQDGPGSLYFYIEAFWDLHCVGSLLDCLDPGSPININATVNT